LASVQYTVDRLGYKVARRSKRRKERLKDYIEDKDSNEKLVRRE
jgi:hypothetical protein